MLKDLFRKTKYVTVQPASQEQKAALPENLWQKCPQCGEIIYKKELEKNLKVCHKCNFHFRLSAWERINLIVDEGTFSEYDQNLLPADPLSFPGYADKVTRAQQETGLNEAIITGEGQINGKKTVIGVMDSRFLMGSMGSVVGEKVCRAIERALENRRPVIIFAASGGARMQEGMLSLMQMAKTSAALSRFSQAGLLYVSVFTDPTTGGVTASFASLGDIILAEPGALIGFTGPRVIEQTIKQKLPEGFQRAESMMRHGFIDMVIDRQHLKLKLSKILELHGVGGA